MANLLMRTGNRILANFRVMKYRRLEWLITEI
jgi:hypothetical protein